MSPVMCMKARRKTAEEVIGGGVGGVYEIPIDAVYKKAHWRGLP